MGDQSAIEWTEATWNPWQGCHKVSPGCKHCYMYREKKQYGQNPAVVIRSKPHTFNMPLRLKDPKRVFTCSWSDFFIEEADPWRDEAWEIIRATPHLTYQILTKRPERMAGRLPWHRRLEHTAGVSFITEEPWPNVWLIVSVENQATADERVPILLQTPAAVRGVSYEPALGPVDFTRISGRTSTRVNDAGCMDVLRGVAVYPTSHPEYPEQGYPMEPLDWLVIGGESGPGARPFDLAWARQTIAQGRAVGVPVFIKQLGARPFYKIPEGTAGLGLRDRKGGSPEEWPADLRVREYPR